MRTAAVLARLLHRVWALRWCFSGCPARELYACGQHTIPSDTVCYPAKLIHGHIEKLLDKGVDDHLLSVHALQL